MTKPDHDRPPIPGWRLWLYRLIFVFGGTALLLVALELILRLSGFGFPAAPTLPCVVDGRPSYCSNQRFGHRFFAPRLARQFIPFSLPAEKPRDTYRIFVLGASAAQGTPEPSFSFSRILEVMLAETYPDTRFEVINAAIKAVDSHAVRVIAENLAPLGGDVFIVYLGNNEVVGPYGPGAGFPAPVIPLHMALRTTRTSQLLTGLTDAVGLAARVPQNAREFEDTLFRNQIRADDPRLSSVRINLQRNLTDIVETAAEHGLVTILGTVGCNLKDHPPFASLHRSDLTENERRSWEEIYERGVAAERDGAFATALERYDEARRIDATHADLHFRIARCSAELGRWGEAREHYGRARDLSTLRFRPTDEINAAIRSVARAHASRGVRLVDSAAALARASPHGIPGEELFLDHVHLNFDGNYLVAQQVFRQLQGSLPEALPAVDPPGRAECAAALAYTEWDELRLRRIMLEAFFKQSLFPNQIYHEQRVARLERELQGSEASMTPANLRAIASQYRQAMARDWKDPMLLERYRLLQQEMIYRGALRVR